MTDCHGVQNVTGASITCVWTFIPPETVSTSSQAHKHKEDLVSKTGGPMELFLSTSIGWRIQHGRNNVIVDRVAPNGKSMPVTIFSSI